MDEYDVGLLNDWGGGNVAWWHDYLRYEIASANAHWAEQVESIRAELAELRKPDCRTCVHYYELEQDCFLLRRGKHCINASEYEINNRPLRLYEKE